jgi:hypothetical protein
MRSNARVRILAGPVGSGKTTCCLFELLRRACEQAPAEDGIRYTRFAIVRSTLQQLKMTVQKDIESWLRPICNYKVSESTFYIEFNDVKSEWILLPLETPEDQRRLLSSQLTGAWMSEAIEMPVELVGPILGRCGRYPSGTTGTVTWRGLIADTNMPVLNSDWHKLMAVETPPLWDVFVQPGGLTDEAENLEWLLQTEATLKLPPDDPRRRDAGRVYYEEMLHGGQSEAWKDRYLHANYGQDPSGTAVFGQSFKQAFHVVDEVMPIPGIPLIIPQDFGRDPCSLILQVDHMGRVLVLEEVLAEDIGLELHIQQSLRPKLLQERYLGYKLAIVGDPSGVAKGTIMEESCFDALKRFGFPAFPAPTNEIDARLRAVEAFLMAQRGGGPAILFDRARCPMLIRGMSGGYRYAKTRAGVRKPNPDKNEYSHIADCLQYGCLVAHGGMSDYITRRLTPRAAPPRPAITAGAWT